MNQAHQKLLAIVGYQLFGGDMPQINTGDISDILKEAKAQTVFTTVFPLLQEKLKDSTPNAFLQYQEEFYGNVITNTNNFMEHAELHNLMTKNDIPYVTMKGLASAYYLYIPPQEHHLHGVLAPPSRSFSTALYGVERHPL